MVQKFNFRLDQRLDEQDFASWAGLHTIAHHKLKDPKMQEIWDAIRPGPVDIEFKINGVEAPFELFLKRMDEQIDQMIEEKAKKMVIGRCGDLVPSLPWKYGG